MASLKIKDENGNVTTIPVVKTLVVKEYTDAKPEQEKTIDITENGTTEVTPDEGKVLSKVTVNVEVESGNDDYVWVEDDSEVVYEKKCYQNGGVSMYITKNGTLTYAINGTNSTAITPKWSYNNFNNMCIGFGENTKHIIDVRQAEVIPTTEKLPNVTITEIGNSAFFGMSNLKIVKIPNTITKLGQYVFSYCENIKEIELPSSIHTWSAACFRYCVNLQKFNIPNLISNIPDYCFTDCRSLKEVNGIERAITIGASAFDTCVNLEGTIVFNELLESIGNYAFRNCCSIEKIIFRGTPTGSIVANVFSYCSGITDIYVPWAEGEVENAPWGATNATIHYNTTYDENHNPIV